MSFADTLIEVARSRPLEESRFLTSLQKGDYPRSALKIYAMRYMRICQDFMRHLAGILMHCDDPQLRFHIIENLFEEEGIGISEKKHALEKVPHKNHLEMFKIFGLALGVPEQDLKNPPWKGKVTWLENAIMKEKWPEAAAFTFVGGEANPSRFFRVMIPAFKKNYGLSDEDLVFYHEHIPADERHSSVGAKLLEQWVTTDEDKKLLLEAAKRGAQAWWVFHELCHRDMRRQMASSPSLYK